MGDLHKKLHGLQAILREDGRTITLQKVDAENVLITAESGNKSIQIRATMSQLLEALNRLDLWDKKEIDNE